MMLMKPFPLVAFCVATFVACESEPLGSDADTAYQIENMCTGRAPACSDDYDSCVSAGSSSCRRCFEIGGFGCASYCDYVNDCRRWHCRDDRPCVQWTYVATLGESDPALYEACQRASRHHFACGDDPYPLGGCEIFAATERAEAAGVYECVADSACGDEGACEPLRPSTDLAQHTCEAMGACGLTWEDCESGAFAAWLGWMRHDVKRALRRCADMAECGDRIGCYAGWLQSLDPE
jgi:hypothetical protein